MLVVVVIVVVAAAFLGSNLYSIFGRGDRVPKTSHVTMIVFKAKSAVTSIPVPVK